jgi:hypothetical protein
MNVQKKIIKIMASKDGDKDIELRKLAQSLGCSLDSTYSGQNAKHLQEEVIRRIQEAARSLREARLWWIAVISAIASAFSALAAWFAVLIKSK